MPADHPNSLPGRENDNSVPNRETESETMSGIEGAAENKEEHPPQQNSSSRRTRHPTSAWDNRKLIYQRILQNSDTRNALKKIGQGTNHAKSFYLEKIDFERNRWTHRTKDAGRIILVAEEIDGDVRLSLVENCKLGITGINHPAVVLAPLVMVVLKVDNTYELPDNWWWLLCISIETPITGNNSKSIYIDMPQAKVLSVEEHDRQEHKIARAHLVGLYNADADHGVPGFPEISYAEMGRKIRGFLAEHLSTAAKSPDQGPVSASDANEGQGSQDAEDTE